MGCERGRFDYLKGNGNGHYTRPEDLTTDNKLWNLYGNRIDEKYQQQREVRKRLAELLSPTKTGPETKNHKKNKRSF